MKKKFRIGVDPYVIDISKLECLINELNQYGEFIGEEFVYDTRNEEEIGKIFEKFFNQK